MMAGIKWLLGLMCGSTMILSTFASADNAADSAAEAVFRQGLVHCLQASRLSRTQVDTARTELGQYLSHLERANTISHAWVESSEFAQRETHRCTLVKDNIDRIHAMVLAEQGMEQCLAVQNELKSGTVDAAKHHFQNYLQFRQAAMAVTPSVLKVGSLGTRMRRCDQLEEKIAAADAWLNRLNAEVQSLRVVYQTAANHCSLGMKLVQGGQPADARLGASREVLDRMDQALLPLQPSAAALRDPGIAELVQQVEDCQQSLLMDVAAMRLQLQEEAAGSVNSAVVQLADPGL